MSDKLNILILTLKTGEEVVSNVKDHIETVDGVERKVCYNMIYPFVLTRSGPLQDKQVGMLLTPWKIFSCDTSFLIGFDQVINMCAPLPSVIEQYKGACDQFIQTLWRNTKMIYEYDFFDRNQLRQILSIFDAGKFVDGAISGSKDKFVKDNTQQEDIELNKMANSAIAKVIKESHIYHLHPLNKISPCYHVKI